MATITRTLQEDKHLQNSQSADLPVERDVTNTCGLGDSSDELLSNRLFVLGCDRAVDDLAKKLGFEVSKLRRNPSDSKVAAKIARMEMEQKIAAHFAALDPTSTEALKEFFKFGLTNAGALANDIVEQRRLVNMHLLMANRVLSRVARQTTSWVMGYEDGFVARERSAVVADGVPPVETVRRSIVEEVLDAEDSEIPDNNLGRLRMHSDADIVSALEYLYLDMREISDVLQSAVKFDQDSGEYQSVTLALFSHMDDQGVWIDACSVAEARQAYHHGISKAKEAAAKKQNLVSALDMYTAKTPAPESAENDAPATTGCDLADSLYAK